MTREEFCKSHWEYYMVLEKDFLNVERFVSFDLGDNYLYNGGTPTHVENSQVYSVEFVKQYLAICSEVDVILKTICGELGDVTSETMPAYTNTILGDAFWQNIVNQKVKFCDMELNPFANWSSSPYKSPEWWTPYNGVKHQRLEKGKEANLKNVVNSLAGLYVLGNYLVKYIDDKIVPKNLDNIDVPNDKSKAFQMMNWYTRWSVISKNIYDIPRHKISGMFQ